MIDQTPPALAPEEIRLFGIQGYSGPFTLCSPEEIQPMRERIEREVLTSTSALSDEPERDRFRDQRVVYDLCTHPRILDVVTCLLGPDVLLFASSFFAKEAGFPEFPWHSDGPYWHMNPVIGLTAWIALDDATLENGCVAVLPGSHRRVTPHEPIGYDRWSSIKRRMGKRVIQGRRAVMKNLDERRAVEMPVSAGQFFLFTESMVHRSGANHTDRRRTGLAARFTTPVVRFRHELIHPEHRVTLVRGEDRFGWNRLASPPARVHAPA